MIDARLRDGSGCCAVFAFALALAEPSAAASIEARLGGAWNVPLPIRVEQRGAEDLRFTARWATRAFSFPLYYGVRVAGGPGDRWALDLTHHKLHLENLPPEIESLSISHGYNLLSLQRRVGEGRRHLGLGAGVVVAHPESRVRGRKADESGGLFRSGYHLAGPCVEALGAESRALGGRWLARAELRLTLAYARVPVADGHARVPNLAVHGTVGLGWRTRPLDAEP